jgi:hypothetical protein
MVAERPVHSPPIFGSEQVVERGRVAPSQLLNHPLVERHTLLCGGGHEAEAMCGPRTCRCIADLSATAVARGRNRSGRPLLRRSPAGCLRSLHAPSAHASTATETRCTRRRTRGTPATTQRGMCSSPWRRSSRCGLTTRLVRNLISRVISGLGRCAWLGKGGFLDHGARSKLDIAGDIKFGKVHWLRKCAFLDHEVRSKLDIAGDIRFGKVHMVEKVRSAMSRRTSPPGAAETHESPRGSHANRSVPTALASHAPAPPPTHQASRH